MLEFLAESHLLLYLITGYGIILIIGFFYYPVKFLLYNIRILIQKEISLFLSHVKLIDINKIDMLKREAKYLNRLLQPGDLVFSRKIGYLSNYFIPGYFSHAMIYVGSWKSFSKKFGKICLKNYGIPIDSFMTRNFPRIHSILRNHQMQILHVTGKGVSLQNLLFETNFEGLCAIRTQMPIEDLFNSVLIAFENYGKAYDFSFDFKSKEGLICSELIWTSYRKMKNKKGLNLRLIPFADVKNISPTPLLKQALYERKQNFPVRFIFFLMYDIHKKILTYHNKRKLLMKLKE